MNDVNRSTHLLALGTLVGSSLLAFLPYLGLFRGDFIWDDDLWIVENYRPRCATCENPYGGGDAGKRVAGILAGVELGPRLLEKKTVIL